LRLVFLWLGVVGIVAAPVIFVRRRRRNVPSDFREYGGYRPFLLHIAFIAAFGVSGLIFAVGPSHFSYWLLFAIYGVGGVLDMTVGTWSRLRSRRRETR
jgi:hypothetical protein